MTLCFADYFGKPTWTADAILQMTNEEVASYEGIYRAALQFSRSWLQGQETFQLFTSGSTGTPQPVAISRLQMLASIRATAAALQLSSGQSALVCLNPAYVAGIMMLARGWQLGLHMYLVAPTSRPLQHFDTHMRFDFVAMVPLQLQQSICHQPDKYILDRCGNIIVGGAAMNVALEQATQSVRATVYATFGMTETVSHIALRRINGKHPEADYGLLPNITAQTDERSCLMICGEVTQGRWITTNDIVTFTAPRRFRFEGRADFVINSGGIKIFPEKLEQQIAALQIPALQNKRFIITAQPDEQLGEQVVLVVETNQLPNVEQIVQCLKEKLPRYHAPQHIFCLPQFPQTATGKVNRKELQQLITDASSANSSANI
ncbi:MAG: AMP-binding protein [Cytophagales bacterium]|nr:AMP-binding protein [Bernardetiaceae bacterium]MDW8204622.1 AMP-binding protein [Cytophagales bacterium]